MNIKIFCRCSFFPFLVGLKTYQHPCMGWDVVDWIRVIRGGYRWRAFLKRGMKLGFLEMMRIS